MGVNGRVGISLSGPNDMSIKSYSSHDKVSHGVTRALGDSGITSDVLPCGHRMSGAHLLHASLSVLFGHVQHVMPSSGSREQYQSKPRRD